MTTSTAILQDASLTIGAQFNSIPATPVAPHADNVVYKEFGATRPLPLPNTTSLSSLMAEFEADDEMAEHLADARRSLGQQLYADEPQTLSALRLTAGLSQTRLAELANTTQPHIAKIESGKTDPGTDTIARIAQALGIDDDTAFRAIRKQRETRG